MTAPKIMINNIHKLTNKADLEKSYDTEGKNYKKTIGDDRTTNAIPLI